MNKFLSIIFILFAYTSFAQPEVPRAGKANTVVDQRWKAGLNAFMPVYLDTSSANAQVGIDSSGAIIYTYSGAKVWIRKHSPKRWEEIGKDASLAGGNLGLGYRLYYPPGQGIKTVFGGYGMLIDSSSNSNGLTFRPDTSVLFPAIRSTIPLQINYTASNGLSLIGSDFRLGGTLSQNTTINANGFLLGITNLPINDTASYDLTINSLGQLIARPIGQSNVFLSQALTSTPTAGGADSLHFTGEINPWPTYTFYGRLSGGLGTQNLTLQNVLDGGTILNKRNVIIANSNNTALDSGGLVINARLAADTSLWVKGPQVLFSGNGFTSFHGNTLMIGSFGMYFGGSRFAQFSASSRINAFQIPLRVNRQYANNASAIYLTVGNDTITGGGLIDSNLIKIYQGTFTSRQTGVTGEKFYVTGRGYVWTREMPYSATVDTLVGWKNGILTATLSSQFAGSGGGGLSGGNLGSAFRLYYPPSQGIKTVFSSYGLAIDSSTSNQINFRVDTNLLSTRLWRDKLKDSLSSLIGTKQNIIIELDDNLTFSSNILGTNTAFQALTDGATITFTTANGINGRVTLGGNRTLSIPSPQNGKIYAVKVFQDGTGGRTLTLPGGASAVLRTGINDSTLITGQYDGINGSWMWFTDYRPSNTFVSSISGTTNQIIASSSTGAITLSTPQNIHTGASPQFLNMGLGVAANSAYALYSSGSTWTGGVTNLSGNVNAVATASYDIHRMAGSIVEPSSGNASLYTGLYINPLTITDNAGTVTNTATLYIPAAATTTVSGGNYSILVNDGVSRFNGPVQTTSGFQAAITTTTGDLTLTNAYHTVLADATSAAITITLPAAVDHPGRIYVIKKIDASVNTITIQRTSPNTIDGATSQTISAQWGSYTLQSNGQNWFLL